MVCPICHGPFSKAAEAAMKATVEPGTAKHVVHNDKKGCGQMIIADRSHNGRIRLKKPGTK